MLHRVLGVRPADLAASVMSSLVEGGESESEHLDFKSKLPTRDAGGYLEHARDVTALANASGGLIVFGVKEIANRAVELTPVPIGRDTDSLLKSLNTAVYPRLRGVRPYTVQASETTPDVGYVILEVLPSPLSPHLVVEGASFSCWRRSGATKVSLTESDLERTYRARFELAATTQSDVERLLKKVRLRSMPANFWLAIVPLDRSDRIWQSIGDAAASVQALAGRPSLRMHEYGCPIRRDIRVRFRRIETALQWGNDIVTKYGWSQLDDVGRFLEVKPVSQRDTGIAGPPQLYVTDQFLLEAVLTTLAVYRDLAEQFDIFGRSLIACGIDMQRAVTFGPSNEMLQPTDPENVETQFDFEIETLATPSGLALAARQIVADLRGTFGLTGEPHIDPVGRILSSRMSSPQKQIFAEWARLNSIETV